MFTARSLWASSPTGFEGMAITGGIRWSGLTRGGSLRSREALWDITVAGSILRHRTLPLPGGPRFLSAPVSWEENADLIAEGLREVVA